MVIKELLGLYAYARSIHPYAGYALLFTIFCFLCYFVFIPIFKIIRIPKRYAPTRDPQKIPNLINLRIKNYKNNPFLKRSDFDFTSVSMDKDGHDKIVQFLEPEMEKIRKKYVTQVFYSTSIAQNGFLDAVLILSASVNLVKELFQLYHGRVSNRDLMRIGKMVYYSMAIGGSEGVEYATDEIATKVFAKGIKGIPFASKILGSIADGFVNAALLTRISLITENYCKFIFIESDRALYPSYRTIISTTRIITSDLIEKIFAEVKHLAKDKTSQIILTTVNPVGYVIGKAIHRFADSSEKLTPQQREFLRDTSL
ncbi:DUF697 domain-containing protein, partial [bacterium]|nr:DUF697 domain-containing protein [bacterium]